MNKHYIFDVDLARELVQDGREPVEVSRPDVRYSVKISRLHDYHVPHVNTEYPGIISYVWLPCADGKWRRGHLLIDGHHRAARCLDLAKPYFAYLLSERESRKILLKSPRLPALRPRSRPRRAAAAR